MDEFIIKDYTEVKSEDWNDYVYNHKDGNIFQTLMYLQLHNQSRKSIPFGFALLQDDKIAGVICGVIYQNFFFPVNIFTKRAVIIGGPLVDDDNEEIIEKLLEKTDKHLSKKAIYIQFRNIRDLSLHNGVFKKSGFIYEDHLDIIHHLENDTETIKKGISKNKRNNVVKAQNRGAEFYEVKDIEEYENGLHLIFETYKRVGLPCPSKYYFINAYKIMLDILKVFAIKYESKIIGIRLELCYKDMVYDWFAGSDGNYKNCYPNDVLPYNILFWSKENNYKKFDFGGAGKSDIPYGVREHKLKFGGELVSYGRFEKVLNPLYYNILKVLLNLSKRLRKK